MLTQLQQYIGNEITYEGERYQLIEILQDRPALVFICMNKSMRIQANQHGNAHRKTHETYTVSCLNENRSDLHPVAKEILPDQIHDQLRLFLLNDSTQA